MSYELKTLPLPALLEPLLGAGAALARLDERIHRSDVGAGLAERLNFTDTCASLYLDGELVPLEDLVLHDVGADVRAPTHELTIAHAVLRSRRRILAHPPEWALSPEGIRALRNEQAPGEGPVAPETKMLPQALAEEDEALARELAAVDAMLARTNALLSRVQSGQGKSPDAGIRPFPQEEVSRDWQALLEETQAVPPLLRAALLLDGWSRSPSATALQPPPWLARQLAAACLRAGGVTTGLHLAPVNLGLRTVRREDRLQRSLAVRLSACLTGIQAGAEAALREHDRLVLARQRLERRLEGRRSSSNLPALVDLVLSRPLVSAPMVSEALGITARAALRLIEELEIRELSGRGRFRVWGII